MTSVNKCKAVTIGNVSIGGPNFVVIAGPCSIESEDILREIAGGIRGFGASILRGGIFKLRTSPDSFQGVGSDGLFVAKKIREELKMPIVCEITDPRQIGDMHDIVDAFQVGSRNMYNYSLLKELGTLKKPVMLKRGFSALIEEWVMAAQYITKGGNDNVILCERGIRSFDRVTRNTLDLASVAHIKQNYSYPVIVDPSHATGIRELVAPMSMAAAAAGADGLLIEVHPKPDQALSDGFQTLDFDQFSTLMNQLGPLLNHLKRPLWS
ncbi:MAG: 3-deoxy-7-phosphoheptulonate synthase [Pseudomonadota bacterium]|nr:3-deoxy-7-phosphoheptulonate synthase [Pseudomonadota bacterium]